MSEADDQTNKAFPKSVNSSNSTGSAQAITSSSDSPWGTLVPLIMPTSQAEQAVAQHLSCLLNELEASRQTVQRQQILIETLTAQLEGSQKRVAQLERDCSHIQDSHNQQSHQLIQIENTCRELRTRLTRQQRQTLQLKVALEKCTDVAVTSYQSQGDNDVISFTTDELSNLKAPYSEPFMTKIEPHNLTTFCLSKAQPIPSWSAQLQFLTSAPEPILNSPSSALQNIWADYSVSCYSYADPSILNWSDKYLSTPVEEPLVVLETYNLNSNRAEADPEGRWEEIASYPKLSWKCTSRSFERQAAAIDLEVHSLELETSEFEAHRQELASLIEAVEELLTTNSLDNLIKEPTVVVSSLQGNPVTQLQESCGQLELAISQLENNSEQVLLDQNASSAHSASELQTELPKPNNLSTFNTKLPSAVVYPLRPPKGRKSLAEIELPLLS